MSKQRHVTKEIRNCIIIAVIAAVIFPLMLIIMSNDIFISAQNKVIYAICYIIATIIALISLFAIIITISYIFIDIGERINAEKNYKNSLIEIQKLTNEFSEVKICDCEKVDILDVLPYDAIKCTAKRDENNNITYRVQIDFEKTTDDYVRFVDNFEIL